jgi:tRNA(fMet)-specific endonuclease VapC
VGLILDTCVLIREEREEFKLAEWLRTRPPEPVGISAITYSELRFGIEAEKNPVRARRRRRWFSKSLRRLEIVPFDSRVALIHARLWATLAESGQMIGPHDLIVAATAVYREWSVVTFNAREFPHPGPRCD